MKLLAVDGNSILNRAYYGIRLLSTKAGIFTNGIYGFLTILNRMQQEVKPDAVVITFDTRAKTFRHLRYDGYKAQRKGMPDELAQQMPPLKELLTALGYRLVELEGFEADDLLGTFSRACCEKADACVIATGDRDSFQLVGDCVSVRLASTKGGQALTEMIDEAAIFEKYGVKPAQLIDVKALMGDSSDNVPGVAGIGEKGALDLIKNYGSLDEIYKDLDALPIRDNLREKLRAGRDMAFLSRELVTINCRAPIDDDIHSYIIAEQAPEAYRLMVKLELFSLMERFGVRPPDSPEQAPEDESPLEIVFNELPEMLLAEGKTLDVLFEWGAGEIKSVLAATPGALYVLDENPTDAARRVLESPAQKRTNGIKDLHRFAMSGGFAVNNLVFDAEIAAYILNPSATEYSLPRLMGEYAAPSVKLDDLFGSNPLWEQAAAFPALADKLTDNLRQNGQYKLFADIELPLAEVLAGMEHAGFSVDADGLRAFGETLDGEIGRLQTEIYEYAGGEFNIQSPKQLGEVLFGKLGLPAHKKTKTGYSTNADVLEELKAKHPIVALVLEYRTLTKLKSTYVDGLLRVVAPDGRIHTSFQQTLTRTGRISSTEPNLQNIPVRTELGSELRRFFRAAEGTLLLDADYSQIELRVLAHIAADENMIAAFQNGEDIHLNTAAQVFDMPPMFVTPLMRSRAKAVNFGIVYGIGAFSLSQDIGVTVQEADSYIKSYLATYSGVRRYMQDTVEFGTEHGFVETMFGRRRHLPELAAQNRQMREFGKRVAMNTPIQGTAADIIKIAMVRVFRRLRDEQLRARLILQVHDELIVECPHDEADRVAILLREEMENAAQLSVPMVAEVGRGANWLEAK